MSIERTSTQPLITNPTTPAAPRQKQGGFDQAKATHQAQVTPRDENAMLAALYDEASDTDSDAAEARAASGMANDDVKDKKSGDDRLLDKARGVVGAKLPAEGLSDEKGSSTLDAGNLARKQAADNAQAESAKVNNVTTVEIANLNVKERHEQLMLLPLSPEAMRTHILGEAADKIATFQSGSLWTRDFEKSDNLNATQMSFMA